MSVCQNWKQGNCSLGWRCPDKHVDDSRGRSRGGFFNRSKYNNNNNNIVDKRINYLKLDDYMITIDDESLNKLSTAQLMQRLRAHNLSTKGLKHELIQRWKTFKLKEKSNDK